VLIIQRLGYYRLFVINSGISYIYFKFNTGDFTSDSNLATKDAKFDAIFERFDAKF
jgi:hypothetical protein